MVQVKETIKLLTKILHENGVSKIEAENFRLAKLNKNDSNVILIFWKLLFEIIYFCECGKIDDVSQKAIKDFTTEELVIYVKREMERHGFYSGDLVSLPSDMSHGSRELLLAFGWIMSKEHVIHQFMSNATTPLADDTSVLIQGGECIENLSEVMFKKTEDPVERVNQMLILNQKLQTNLRNYNTTTTERHLLKHKIHESTYGVSVTPDLKHLSMLETYIIRHPKLLQKNIDLLVSDNQRLQNLLDWRQHEDTFWRWMESVLDAKLQDQDTTSTESDSERSTQNSVMLSTNATLDEFGLPADTMKSHMSLENAIEKYEGIVKHLDYLWSVKRSEITEAELNSLIDSLDLEISIQQTNIAVDHCHDFLKHKTFSPHRTFMPRDKNSCGDFIVNQNPQFVYISPEDKHLTSKNKNDDKTLVSVKSEIENLQKLVSTLQQELEKRQDVFRNEMLSLSQKFKDSAVLIPPSTYS